MPRADLRASGQFCTLCWRLLCRIHTAILRCAKSRCGPLDESNVLNNLHTPQFCEIRHHLGIVTQLVVVVVEPHGELCGGCILHIKWALIGKIYPSAAAVEAACTWLMLIEIFLTCRGPAGSPLAAVRTDESNKRT